MLEYQLQCKDYWKKTRCTVYPYALNEKTKDMNKDPPLPRYGERFIDTKTRFKTTNHDLLSNIEISFNFLKQFLYKYRKNECRKLLESFTKRELKLLVRQAKNLQYHNFQK